MKNKLKEDLLRFNDHVNSGKEIQKLISDCLKEIDQKILLKLQRTIYEKYYGGEKSWNEFKDFIRYVNEIEGGILKFLENYISIEVGKSKESIHYSFYITERKTHSSRSVDVM